MRKFKMLQSIFYYTKIKVNSKIRFSNKRAFYITVAVFLVICFASYYTYSRPRTNHKLKVAIEKDDNILNKQSYIYHNVGAPLDDLNGLHPPDLPIFLKKEYSRDPLYPIKIPKIIHQIWDTYEIPKAFHNWMKTWKKINPSFQYWFWSHADARKLIELHYPAFLILFDNYLSPIYRADAARYFILHHFGGFYFDLDSKALKPLDPWSEAYDCLVSEEPWEHSFVIRDQNQSNILNGFLACKADHPFMKMAIDSLKYAAGRYNGDFQKATGPEFLDRVFDTYVKKITKKPEPHLMPYIHQQHHEQQLKQDKLNKKPVKTKETKQESVQNTHEDNDHNIKYPKNDMIKVSLKEYPEVSSQPPTLTKVSSKYFFPTFDRSEDSTLVFKCSPSNFKKLTSSISKAICKYLIRNSFKQKNTSESYTDHDWLHSYMFHESWKQKDTKNVENIVSDVILASNKLS